MAKKFYDIYPPHIKRQEKDFDKKKNKKRIKIPNFGKLSFFLILGFLVLIFFAYSSYLKAEIIIFPKTEIVSYNGEITIDSRISEMNFDNNHLPGNVFKLEKSQSERFSASGEEIEEKRAEGILRVYNNHSELQQTLVINTRFISSDRKLFKSTERITIPGKSQTGPGYADVRVIAVEPGENFNIERTLKFSIPGLQGTAMYTSIYAENINPITGGFIGRLPKIIQQDVDNARESLIANFISSFKEEIKKNNSGIILIDDLINIEILEEKINPKIEENYESFELYIKVSIQAIFFNESDFRSLIKKRLLNQSMTEDLKENFLFTKKDVWDDFDLFYEVISKNESRAILRVDASGLIYPQVNEELLKEKISNREIKEITDLISSHAMVEKVEINVRPSWISKIPNANKIIINLSVSK